MNTDKKTSDITSTKNLHIALSAIVTEPLVEVRNKIYICVSYVLSPRNQRRNKRKKGKSHFHVRTGLISILGSHVKEDSNTFFLVLKPCRLVGKKLPSSGYKTKCTDIFLKNVWIHLLGYNLSQTRRQEYDIYIIPQFALSN